MKVLIADDDADLRTLLTIAVRKAGHEVDAVVDNGQAAWELLQKTNYDLAVLDISMPRMTGLQVLEKLRESPNLHSHQVLIVSANIDPSVTERLQRLGTNDIVRKPFQMKELVRILTAISDRL